MPIKNYSTGIDPGKTIGEIQNILAPYISQMRTIYNNGGPVALQFGMIINGAEIGFQMPTKWEPVLETLKRQKGVPRNLCTPEQATRVAWRLVKLWIEGQIAFIETNMVKPEQVFFPYIVVDKVGTTLFEREEKKEFLLTDGK